VFDAVGGGFVHGDNQPVLGLGVESESGQPTPQRRSHREKLVGLGAPATTSFAVQCPVARSRTLHHLSSVMRERRCD
jgi:hypothetical protein